MHKVYLAPQGARTTSPGWQRESDHRACTNNRRGDMVAAQHIGNTTIPSDAEHSSPPIDVPASRRCHWERPSHRSATPPEAPHPPSHRHPTELPAPPPPPPRRSRHPSTHNRPQELLHQPPASARPGPSPSRQAHPPRHGCCPPAGGPRSPRPPRWPLGRSTPPRSSPSSSRRQTHTPWSPSPPPRHERRQQGRARQGRGGRQGVWRSGRR